MVPHADAQQRLARLGGEAVHGQLAWLAEVAASAAESWSRAWASGSFCSGIRLGGLFRLAAFSAGGMTESRRDASPLVKKSEDAAGAAPVPAPDTRSAAATKND